jgi:hypothetical protein
MEPIRAYVLRVIVCCFVCAVACKLVDKSKTNQRLVQLISGMVILLTMVSPEVSINNIINFRTFDERLDHAQSYVSDGIARYKKELASRIVSQSEAYILEKAAQMDVSIEVDIILSDDDIPAPVAARIKGNVSPFAKSKLMDMMEKDLGISKERQQWT